MRRSTFVLIALVYSVAVPASFAQDHFIGAWTLNEAKSRIAPGAPKEAKVVYGTEGAATKVTTDGTDGDGNATHSEWTGKFDGVDYPVNGDPDQASRSYKRKGPDVLD